MQSFVSGLSLLALSSSVLALPNPQFSGYDPCDPNQESTTATYANDGATPGPGTPWQGGLACPHDCTVSESETYTLGYSVTYGEDFGLDIDEIFHVGVSISVTESTSAGITEGTAIQCTGPWTCSLLVTPQIASWTGTQTLQDSCGGGETTNSYGMNAPILDAAGNAEQYVTPCACKNFCHWADPGAPPPCPNDCPVPVGGAPAC